MNKFVKKSQHNAKEVASSPPVNYSVRLGYLIRGILYGLIGLFTLEVVIGWSQSSTDLIDVINIISGAPFGFFLLIVIGVGLAGYSLWGLIRASMDLLGLSQDKISLLPRLGYFFSAISYAALLTPIILLLQHKYTGGTHITKEVFQFLILGSIGRAIIFIIGLAVMGAGLFQFYLATRPDLMKTLSVNVSKISWPKFFSFITRYGIAARAAVFTLIGIYLVNAAVTLNPNDAKNFGESLASLKYQPSGNFLLLLNSIGLISFGIYSSLLSKFVKLPGDK